MRLEKSSETAAFCNDCSQWYAVQTTMGYEKKLISTIHLLCKKEAKIYLPVKEMIHRIKGMEYIAELPLFPGYIFVYKNIDELIETLHNSRSSLFAKPVTANGKYLEANKNEMKFLFDITGKDGVIKVSKGIVSEGDKIRIINGPLTNFKGKILFINKRKNKAKARIEIMNRMVEVSLGLEIIHRDSSPRPADRPL